MLRTVFLLSALLFPLSAAAMSGRCSETKNEIHCILKSHPTIYQENPEYFWEVLNRARESALSCTSIEAASNFLSLVSLSPSGADFDEFISEGIEKMCVTQPVCLQQAIGNLDEIGRMAVKKKLENPTFFEPKDTIECSESIGKLE